MITTEASEACKEAKKKVIDKGHIEKAMKKLQFERFFSDSPSSESMGAKADAKALARQRLKNQKHNVKNISQEELAKEQAALFASARERISSGSVP